ncbi:hypothetical protein [Rhodococcus sp. YH1]|uniref:hypothetical protein n=1 Tax=Rhodococcus sp. YH1 TaxID=89066 RepID=UPI001386A3A8|nr:hypothetical protein [Rhodococcus sp. YH1]
MSGTQKKTAPRTAPASTPEPAVERFDILDVLAHDGGEPKPITLFGVEADVRRKFTGEEAAKFHAYLATSQVVAALDLITDGAGQALWDAVMAAKLNAKITAELLNKVISLSELSEGELVPLSPPSAARMAGAVLSQALGAGSTETSEKSSEPSRGETADT